MRTAKKSFKAMKVNMGGVILDQALPYHGKEQIDPFLLIHHWANKMEGGKAPNEVGVGPHPHCGFAPVTFIFKGAVQHRDSMGNNSIVEAGGTQWMNSGKGIVHSERPPKEFAEKGGDFEIIQIWVNAPASKKRVDPNYLPISAEKTPKYVSEDKLMEVGVVAGEVFGLKGIHETYSPMLILRIDYKKGAKLNIPVPKSYNALLYNLDGQLKASDADAGDKDMIEFNNNGDSINLEAKSDGRAILLTGEPINEPLATYGPFVMNTQREIMQMMQKYQEGGMGELVEVFD